MPTYAYACDACGAEFEREQRMTDKPIKKCTSCGKQKARRMIAGSGNFILKGGGWYNDLYSGPSNQKPASGEKKTDGGEKKSDGGGTAKESKPSAKKASAAA